MNIRPNYLRQGDTVGIIAPASPPELEKLEQGIPFLKSLGLRIKLGRHVADRHGYLAGTDEARLEDLHEMFADPQVKGIICACGGYGTARIAAQIDYNLIARNPKVFWGYSDITFLHTAIRQLTGLTTFHGPMVSSDMANEDFAPLSQLMFQQLFQPSELVYSEEISPLQVISPGEATGEIVGGNLTLIISTIGTEAELNTRGKLLFIEDVDEEPYRIDSMLNQLKMTGKLDEAYGIIVGDFKNAVPSKRKSSLTLHQVLDHYLAALNKPVMKGFLIGHCSPHFAIPLGTSAHLSTTLKTLRIAPGVK
ncbi:S66 peptidase family protein [Radiobacillus deserti]|uniref:LD-carboxypeptidase n=1 Tax=Radiobacillus deserti TaxID=2594883 RepID=A0A516KJR7_9BACI|nr:LD-carboxypeptidase [Radiobacillus deserti]QDP41635.1 LD-carboxypeptidase [Radiobacillus deserti]